MFTIPHLEGLEQQVAELRVILANGLIEELPHLKEIEYSSLKLVKIFSPTSGILHIVGTQDCYFVEAITSTVFDVNKVSLPIVAFMGWLEQTGRPGLTVDQMFTSRLFINQENFKENTCEFTVIYYLPEVSSYLGWQLVSRPEGIYPVSRWPLFSQTLGPSYLAKLGVKIES